MIKNYFIKDYESGIRLLLFNTKDRWIDYNQVNDETYDFGDEDYIIEIEFPPFKNDRSMLCTHLQCKDQIYFYWIPYDMIKTGEILVKKEIEL